MKLTTFALILFTLQISASVYSQQTRLTLDVQNQSIKEVLFQIERLSEFRFMYESGKMNLDKKVSVKVKDQTVESILNQLFDKENVKYEITGNNLILINPAETKIGESTLPGATQQKKNIAGVVVDATGETIIGANVIEKGTTNGVITDLDGTFSLQVANQATLQISYIGYHTQEIPVKNQTSLRITLVEDSKTLDEVVVVGYGTQKKGNLTGAIASVKADEIVSAPVASTSNALAGRLPGLVSLQSSGQPGSDGADLKIRGFNRALYIVDGIEIKSNELNTIDPNQIESISILKDGSASIYGSRAGNGVILITTKRGVEQKPIVTLNATYSLQGITSMPKPASAGQYAEMEREKWLQAGKPEEQAPFTEEQIRKYYDGSDPQYPNTDWYKELIRDWSPQQQYNLSIRGGSDKIKYYGFLGYLDQESIWKTKGGSYNHYNLQSNIDAKITDQLTMQLDLSGTSYETTFPVRPQFSGPNTVWQDLWNTLPIYPATLPDPTKVSYANGSGTGGAHVTSNYDLSGTNRSSKQNLKGTGVLNYKFKAIEGLSAKLFVNYVRDYSKEQVFSKPVQYYTYDIASQKYTLAGALGSQAQLRVKQEQGSILTTQFSFNYDRVFNGIHHLTAMGLYEGIDYKSEWFNAGRDNFISTAIEQLFAGNRETAQNDGAAFEMGRQSYIGRLNYSYKDKYLIETTLRADASSKFPSNKRWGYFPSVSLGWRISQEQFMENNSVINDLKIRASYGKSGNDFLEDPNNSNRDLGNFAYMSGYKFDGSYLLGSTTQQGIISSGLPNPNLTWEKIEIYNLGANWTLWDRKLYGEADVFYRTRSGIPANRTKSVSSTIGATLPPENINSINDRGFEFMAGTSGTLGEWTYDISGNISWSRSKWDHYEEAQFSDPDDIRINQKSGQWTDREFGYLSDKLFTSQAEIDALKYDQDNQKNITLRPGDIRYIDINGDGIVDWRDQAEIGKGTTPHWMYGINFNLKYKRFDLATLFQGAFGYYTEVVMTRTTLLYPEEVYELRWTQQNNNPNALVPRLGGASTNGLNSDYRYKDAGYLRLKQMSVGYNLPANLLSKVNIQQARVHLSGTNLFTFDKLKKYGIDPEAPSRMGGYYYPQQRVISVGLNASF